jgi:hypothetical protein
VAIFHFSAKVISRSAGRSSVAAAAYRAAERLLDERTGLVHDFTRKTDVDFATILAPANAPEWASDRSRLWNEAELTENRKNSRTAREFEIALPRELADGERRSLLFAWINDEFTSRGIVADVSIHRGHGTGEHENPHAHIMIATRTFEDGKFGAKVRDLDKPETLEKWRESWEIAANRALERADRNERIDHRSLADQGIDREPTVHLGQRVTALEKQGVATERGEINRAISAFAKSREIAEQIGKTLSDAWKSLEIRATEEAKRWLKPLYDDKPVVNVVHGIDKTAEGQTGLAKRLLRDPEHGISVLILKNDDKSIWKPYHYQGLRIDEASADAMPSLHSSAMRKREIAFSGEPDGLVHVERDPASLERERGRDRGRSIADEIPMSRGGDPYDHRSSRSRDDDNDPFER